MDVEEWQAGHPWIRGWPGSTVGPKQIPKSFLDFSCSWKNIVDQIVPTHFPEKLHAERRDPTPRNFLINHTQFRQGYGEALLGPVMPV